ncbi:hypothetical protein NA8A_10838 [Nitratireductor indicus C115]|uniref:Uncharacterized protein n=1 Tax=Nitratireductor indicus C115 TaxID=1231190 RepID=K2N574_9HYPH|nr:hypothetical protein [Nitratireductor indicus]EKF42553.1 hypothetical protein NA8A_10838 [Nitratireductor indicus C115]SFQ57268.1 hypothetical protein SAMN05216176_106200 [Nitratireductor indicus]
MKRLASVAALMSATMLTVAAISPSLAEENAGTRTQTATMRVVAQQDASAPNPAPNSPPVHFSPGMKAPGKDRHAESPRMKDPRGGQGQRGPGNRVHGSGAPGLQIAGKLSAAQTYVGITTDQEDAWRNYSNALIDFFERPDMAPKAAPEGPGGPRPQGPADGPAAGPGERAGNPQQIGPDAPRPLLAERIAGFAIQQGEKGKALKDAFDTLKSELRTDQLDRLAKAERAFAPGRHGPEHRGPGRSGPEQGQMGRFGPGQVSGPREGFSPPSGE